MRDILTSEEAESEPVLRRNSQVEEQLRHTEEKLRQKEREVMWEYHSALQHIHDLHALFDSELHTHR